MKLPKTIKVGPYFWKVVHRKIPEVEECRGDCIPTKETIRITTGLSKLTTVETLMHEVFHAIYYSWSLEDEDKEERVVSLISTAFAAVLLDNPEFTKLLMETFCEQFLHTGIECGNGAHPQDRGNVNKKG